MSDLIKYDYTTIQSALDDISSRHAVLLSQADQIRAEQKKFESAWEDPDSAAAYQVKQTQWNQSFEDINNILQQVKNAAANAVVSMQATNAKAAQGWM